MNKQEYLDARNVLVGEAEALIDEGKLDEAEAKQEEIKALDEKFNEISKAQANLSALKEKVVVEEVKDLKVDKPVEVNEEPVDEKKLYLNAWAKEMSGRKLNEDEQSIFDKINTEFHNDVQTADTHGVVIPETVGDNIWKEAAELYPIVNDLRMTFVPGDMTLLQETSSGADAAWYDEDTEVADGDFAISELKLTGCELSKAIPVSWKLRKMSIERFIPYITSLLAEKMGAALAKGVVSGKGKPGTSDTFKPQPKGIITALEAETDTPQIIEYGDGGEGEAAVLSYDTLALAMGKIKSSYKSGSSIYAKSNVIWGQLALLKDGEGRPIFISDVTSGGVGRIFGLPVKEDDSVPDDAILIGNVSRGYACNVNENMTLYTEDHKKLRYTDYMSYAIVDGDVLTTKAFALIAKEEVEAV